MFLVGEFGLGGAEKLLYHIVRNLNSKKHKVIVLSLSKGGFYKNKIEQLGVNVQSVNQSKYFIFRLIKNF